MKKLLHTLSALILALAMAGNVQAQPLTLQALLDGETITAGDKLFDEWTFFDYFASDFDRVFDASNILVTALDDGGLKPGPGLLFSVLNDELTITGDGWYSYVDLMFGFRVSVLDPSLDIVDNSLLINSGVISNPDGIENAGIYIRETIGTAQGLENLGVKAVELSYLSADDPIETRNLFDSATFARQSEIWVTKNILVWAEDPNDTASLSGFTQRFSQVPEPATLGLLALGLAGLGFMRRRRT